MCSHNQSEHRDNQDLFEAFPAPRVWQFGGDVWAGNAHAKDTTDFLPPSPQIQISIIGNASVR